MSTQRSYKLFLSLALALGFSMSAAVLADSATPTAQSAQHHHKHKHHMKKVLEACAKANGITLPTKGSGETLSTGDRTTLHACFEQFHASVHTCLQNAGVSKPEPGVKPSDSDKAAFKQCFSESLTSISS